MLQTRDHMYIKYCFFLLFIILRQVLVLYDLFQYATLKTFFLEFIRFKAGRRRFARSFYSEN